MNVLEKAHLAKELQSIIQGLNQRSLSFYEIAKSKNRIKEIFNHCDQPIFKKQILNFKSYIHPELTAEEFAKQSLYAQTFRGVFLHDQALESALEQHPEMGWAILYRPDLGFQIWYIPAPHRTALLSDWAGLDHNYAWMLEQQEHYAALKSDTELMQQAAETPKNFKSALKMNRTATFPSVKPASDSSLAASHQTAAQAKSFHFESLLLQKERSASIEHETEHTLFSTTEIALSKNDLQSDSINTTKKLAVTPSAIRTLLKPRKPEQVLPSVVELGQWKCRLTAVDFPQAQEHALCRLILENVPDLSPMLEVIVPASHLEQDLNHPVYLAEQINHQGRFIKYLAILGAEDQLQAIRLANLYSQHNAYEITAVKLLPSDHSLKQCKQAEQLFELYSEQTELVWNTEHYLPYISAHCLQKHKLIAFEETIANYNTPLLLLKERQKIRVVHGQNRLQLSPQETHYPYILLDRNQGISWQLIQRIIQTLPQPISVANLHAAIQLHIGS